VESDINFIERRTMKSVSYSLGVLIMCALLSSCGILCQAGTGTCGMSSGQAQRLLHPKAYGEYWTKPGMTTEGWRRDWVACGGMVDGGYTSNSPLGSSTSAILAAVGKKKNELSSCMQSKGYDQSLGQEYR
jgi:hypothetical protein